MQPERGVEVGVVARATVWGTCIALVLLLALAQTGEAAMTASSGTGSVTYDGGDTSFSTTGAVPFPPAVPLGTGGGGPATTGAMYMIQDFDPPPAGIPYGVYVSPFPTAAFLAQTVPPEDPPVTLASLFGVFDVDFIVGPGGHGAEVRSLGYVVAWGAAGSSVVTFDVTITYTLDPYGTPIALGGQSLSFSESGSGSPGTIVTGTSLALPAFAPGDVVKLSGSFLVTVDDEAGGPSSELTLLGPVPVPTPSAAVMGGTLALLAMHRSRRRR